MIILYTALALQIPFFFFLFVIKLLIRKKVQLLSCMECQRCTASCPVLKKHPEFIGPYGVMKAVKKERYDLVAQGHLEFCTQCGLCSKACPRNLDALEEAMSVAEGLQGKKRKITWAIPLRHRETKPPTSDT